MMMSHDVRTAGPLLDEDGRVAGDLSCLQCAYNLRTLRVRGVCPECGAPVALSARDDRLCQAAPKWVRGLARGATMILVGVLAPIGGLLVGEVFSPHGMIAALVGMLVGISFAILGALRLTERDPQLEGLPEGLSARRIVRLSMAAPAVLWFLAAAAGPGLITKLLGAANIGILGMLLIPAFLQCLAELMRRIPRDDLVRELAFVRWGIVAAAAGGCSSMFLAIPPGGGPGTRLASLAVLSLTVATAMAIIGIIVLVRIRAALARVAREFLENAW